MKHDLTGVEFFYIYQYSDNTAAFITTKTVEVGDQVKYENFSGTVTRCMIEPTEGVYRKKGSNWIEITITK